jgi:hypothetical protein
MKAWFARSSGSLCDDADQVNSLLPLVRDFQLPLLARLKPAIEVLEQLSGDDRGLAPCRIFIGQFLTDQILPPALMVDVEKVSRHEMQTRYGNDGSWRAIDAAETFRESQRCRSARKRKAQSMKRMSVGQVVLLAALIILLGLSIIWAVSAWNDASSVEMSVHGWIALGLGTFFSLLIGCGLMALMFYSDRSGHDDVADPFRGRKPPGS